jgi:phosphoribosylglycinamide formyltransferase-1
MQEHVPIYPSDSLADVEARVHATEHRLYPQAIKKVLTALTEKE